MASMLTCNFTRAIISELCELVPLKTFFCLKVYEEIASHFSETRHKPWPNVKNFVESQQPGAVILDVGCGNGKYLGLNSQAFQVSEPIQEKKIEYFKHRSFRLAVT
jgi:alkylated DNA repair protein alkB homolog 8